MSETWLFARHHVLAWALSILAACGFRAQAVAAVTWEQQAERLQNVSATLLDAFPVGEPIASPFSLELRTIVSFLPETNPRVGTKSEKVPTSPVHAVPTLQVNGLLFQTSLLRLGFQGWAGYLPEGGEALFGIDAKLKQWLAGGSAQAIFPAKGVEIVLPVGFQMSDARLTGAITAPDAADEFSARSRLLYVAPGIRIPAWSIWLNGLVAKKNTKSTFKIPVEGTNLALTDTLADSDAPYAFQGSIGWMHKSGVQIGASQLYVPKRLTMPRMLLSYQYSFR